MHHLQIYSKQHLNIDGHHKLTEYLIVSEKAKYLKKMASNLS